MPSPIIGAVGSLVGGVVQSNAAKKAAKAQGAAADASTELGYAQLAESQRQYQDTVKRAQSQQVAINRKFDSVKNVNQSHISQSTQAQIQAQEAARAQQIAALQGGANAQTQVYSTAYNTSRGELRVGERAANSALTRAYQDNQAGLDNNLTRQTALADSTYNGNLTNLQKTLHGTNSILNLGKSRAQDDIDGAYSTQLNTLRQGYKDQSGIFAQGAQSAGANLQTSHDRQVQDAARGYNAQKGILDGSLGSAQNALNSAYTAQEKELRGAQGLFDPYGRAGDAATAAMQYEMGLGDRPTDYQGMQGSEAYKWRVNEGTAALDASSAARGGAVSGRALQGAQEMGQGLASQEYDNHYARLSGMSSQGLAARGAQAGLSSQIADARGSLGQGLAGLDTWHGGNLSAARDAQTGRTIAARSELGQGLAGLDTWQAGNTAAANASMTQGIATATDNRGVRSAGLDTSLAGALADARQKHGDQQNAARNLRASQIGSANDMNAQLMAALNSQYGSDMAAGVRNNAATLADLANNYGTQRAGIAANLGNSLANVGAQAGANLSNIQANHGNAMVNNLNNWASQGAANMAQTNALISNAGNNYQTGQANANGVISNGIAGRANAISAGATGKSNAFNDVLGNITSMYSMNSMLKGGLWGA